MVDTESREGLVARNAIYQSIEGRSSNFSGSVFEMELMVQQDK